MKRTMQYKGYHTSVEYHADDDLLVGHILNISDIVGFHGESITEFRKAFRDSVTDYIAHCKEIGKKPNKPFSGKVMFRFDPKVHAKAALAAQMEGISLNQWAEKVLEKAANSA
jgi:predicted HicB family RNase H-like nuclease